MRLLEIVALIIFIAWVTGFFLHIAGGLTNILLALAFILFLSEIFKAKYR